MYKVGHGADALYCADRSYARHGASSELAIYKYDTIFNCYRLVFYLPVVRGSSRAVTLKDGNLVVSQEQEYDGEVTQVETPLRVLLGITPRASGLPVPPTIDGFSLPETREFPGDEGELLISRAVALEVAREALSQDGLVVWGLEPLQNERWGVVWCAESVLPEAPPGMDGASRSVIISSETGEVITTLNWGWAVERPRCKRDQINQVAP